MGKGKVNLLAVISDILSGKVTVERGHGYWLYVDGRMIEDVDRVSTLEEEAKIRTKFSRHCVWIEKARTSSS